MRSLRKVSGDPNLHFYGYGGKYMAAEGFKQTIDLNIDNLHDKAFHTYRKTKNISQWHTYKWHPLNLVNKHYTRNADMTYEMLEANDVAKRIYQSRPNLVLNIGNEYLT